MVDDEFKRFSVTNWWQFAKSSTSTFGYIKERDHYYCCTIVVTIQCQNFNEKLIYDLTITEKDIK